MEIKTVADLLEALQGAHPDTPVHMAQQPSWPFEYTVGSAGLVVVDGVEGFWLGEGTQVGYLPAQAAFDLGWSNRDPRRDDEQ